MEKWIKSNPYNEFSSNISFCIHNLNAYVSHLFLFTYIHLTATESSIHLKSLALR